MADAVTSTTIADDDRKAVIQLTNTSDGTGESAVTKIDVSALAARSSDGAACTGCKLYDINYSTFGMSVKLLWNATTNTICWDLNSDYSDYVDFSYMGGLQNTAAASGKTGDIKLTTTGHASGDSYVIVLTVVKEY
jgi:hypothetical protein|tara:strand:+ start:61 stop:468 length:408 start_codon:yes stop_codon:yes gene_type:complete